VVKTDCPLYEQADFLGAMLASTHASHFSLP
jgi:hypothetical protein